MTIEKKLLGTSPSGGDAPNVEDVFSTYLYEGTGSAQTITNGIDLAGEGGLVWAKWRSGVVGSGAHVLVDTERGVNYWLSSSTTSAQNTTQNSVTAFNSNGFSIVDAGGKTNYSGEDYASWTFRKAPRFFDVVTYTGNGVAGHTIAHDLGVAPGMIIVKRTDTQGSWIVQHRSLTSTHMIKLETSEAAVDFDDAWYDTEPTDANFTLGSWSYVNASGGTYVAYLFAHDPVGENDDGLIACGSYVGNGSTDGPEINLGWEPQYVLVKDTSTAASWRIIDSMRGAITGSDDRQLRADTSSAEFDNPGLDLTGYGFKITAGDYSEHNRNGSTFIYMAIRAPMMVEPEAGTEVFAIDTRGSVSSTQAEPGWRSGFPVDMFIETQVDFSADVKSATRLTGTSRLITNATYAAGTSAHYTFDYNNGWSYVTSTVSDAYSWMFKRAKGFFDVVAYTGTGSAHAENHSLGVVPEMMIVKDRSGVNHWWVYHKDTGNTSYLILNLGYGVATSQPQSWNSTTPTASVFSVGTQGQVNTTTHAYISYLFASATGVSKVGSYTGNGSNQNIACGFSAGARFVLIKRTDTNGDWYIWDTERGIVAGNDSHLSLNTTAAQVSTDDSIDPQSAGFTVNQVTATNINVTNGTYIFLAIA